LYRRKIITFDIDTKVAHQIFGDNYRNIYRMLGLELHKIGLHHVEGSVYQSDFAISDYDFTYEIMQIMNKKPKLSQCIREIHYGDAPKFNSLNHLTKYDGTPGKYAKKEVDVKKLQKKLFSTDKNKNVEFEKNELEL